MESPQQDPFESGTLREDINLSKSRKPLSAITNQKQSSSSLISRTPPEVSTQPSALTFLGKTDDDKLKGGHRSKPVQQEQGKEVPHRI